MNNEQRDIYTRYENYMRELYPDKYKGLCFDYKKQKWYKPKLVVMKPPRETRKYKKKLDDEVREYILNRDGYRCVRCGGKNDLHIHHKVHRENGGEDILDNLETLCEKCHALEHEGEPVFYLMRKSLASKGIKI